MGGDLPVLQFQGYDLTNNHSGLSNLGLDIVVVFKSDREEVLKFIVFRPHPFRMVANPDGNVHRAFFVNRPM